MINTVDSLKFITYNCKGFKDRNFNYLKELFDKNDILFLQETWLYSFQDDIIKNVLPNSECCSVSGMKDDDVGRAGRPFGGSAIVWKNNLPLGVSPIKTNSSRVCAALAEISNNKFVIISVYMPCNDNSIANINEFEEVLNEISSILDSNDDCQVLIGGDFNLDITRDKSSMIFGHFNEFLTREGLLCNADIFKLNGNLYTYHGVNGVTSNIDHFIFSSGFLSCIEKFDVLIQGQNLSDHQPLFINYKIDNFVLNNDDINNYEQMNNDSYNWDNASKENIEMYKNILDELLNAIMIPKEVVECKDMFCTKHGDIIMEYFNEIVEAVSLSTSVAIPVKKRFNKKHIVPGWNRYVEFYKKKAIFWHTVWKDAGSPQNGELSMIRRYSRKKYHESIIFIKKNREYIIQEKIAGSNEINSSKLFWSEINKLKFKSKTSTNIMDGRIGCGEIVPHLKRKYEDLYNEFNDDKIETKNRLNEKIRINCLKNKCKSDHSISAVEVRNIVRNLKNNKHDHIYKVSSNAIKNATEFFYRNLALIFNLMVTHGISTEKIHKSIIISIVKDKRKSKSSSDNYRGISLSSVFCKLFELFILKKIDKSLMTNKFQFGFKEKHSTTLCASALTQTIQYYLDGSSNVYACFLDASKAFDRVRHSRLFDILLEKEICPLYVRFIFIMYNLNNASVRWNNDYSEIFSLSNGIKQGGNLSPYLFALYINPLLDRLNDSRIGCFIGDVPCNVFAFADDVALISPSLAGMKCLIKICEQYGLEYSVKFNPEKCKIMIFSRNRINLDLIDIKSNGVHFGITNEMKY